jgi:uncharacterized phage protein (TIGR02218 family)
VSAALQNHMASGNTRLCQCWSLERRDGARFGFTDHDRDLSFDGITFLAGSGMSAKAFSHATGLSVNNTEAVGVLRDTAVTEADIAAGRYDGAAITIWRVRWDAPAERAVIFRGTIGEITRRGGAFEADLRGLTEQLNQPRGRAYLRQCSAVLGDAKCRFNLDDPAYAAEVTLDAAPDGAVVKLSPATAFNDRWFDGGSLRVLDGGAQGITRAIKHDRITGGAREITLWQALPGLAAGDTVRIVAGCDRRAETCRVKFDNLRNFQGFPHVPGDDWMLAVPRSDGQADGGSLFR